MSETLLAQWKMFLQEVALFPSLIDRWDFTYRHMISFFGPHVTGGARVLDIGCGEGVLSLFFAHLGCQVLAIDQSGYQIAQNSAMSRKVGLISVQFKAVEFEDLVYEVEEPYDIVICTDVLEHFEDSESAIKKIVKYMKDEGKLLISLPSPSAPVHRLRMRLLGRDPFDAAVSYKRRFSVMDLRELVNGAGLTLVEIRQVDGLIKNLFYVTGVGQHMQRLNRWVIKDMLFSLDQVFLKYLGGSGHYAVAHKGRPVRES
jgi:SAM-dependent methyltransferase